MRVLLINPFYPIPETPSPPLGLAYLGAALEQAGVQVKILDYVVYPYQRDAIESVLKEFKPHIAGATAVSMTVDHAKQILRDVKTIDCEILTVMGGPHVTFCAEHTLETFPELDVVALGEGEATLVDLVNAVECTRSFNTVSGIAYRMGLKIRTTTKRKWIKNLDTLSFPARHLLPLGRYRSLGMPMSITTSRGCPYQCIFCVGRKMVGARVRYHSAYRAAAEMQYLANLGFHQINIADDLFTANKNHCLGVCEEILRRNLKINWTAFARVDTVSERLLSKMKAAGCTAVSFGIESANPAILKTIKKGITVRQAQEAVRKCLRVGISPYASFILGLPGETPETIKETTTFATELQQEGLAYGYHILTPFPGTEVREQSNRLGIRILTDDWPRYDANRSIIETVSVDHKMLDAVVVDWKNKYDQYLGQIYNNIQNDIATEDEIRQVENLENTVTLYDLMMKNQIEKYGELASPVGGCMINREKGLEILMDRIIGSSEIDPKKLKSALQQAVENEDLEINNSDGTVQWKWRSFLPPEQKVPKIPKVS